MRTPVKIVLATLAAIAVVYLLFTAVFPWVDRTLLTDPVMDAGGQQQLTAASTQPVGP